MKAFVANYFSNPTHGPPSQLAQPRSQNHSQAAGWPPAIRKTALLLAWLLQEPLRKFAPPSARGLPVGEQWSRARAWHEPARQVLKAHGCDSALAPDPRERPSARELQRLINS